MRAQIGTKWRLDYCKDSDDVGSKSRKHHFTPPSLPMQRMENEFVFTSPSYTQSSLFDPIGFGGVIKD